MKPSVRVRFAPSPTGPLHIGGARTALFNYLFAKKQNGTFILRIDDTDQERSKPEFETSIISGLNWLSLKADETYRQSERTKLYQEQLEKLIATDQAYVSKETPQKAGDRAEVIRLRNPGREIKFTDLIKGEISFNTTELGDFVIAKDLGTPVYHFASVVDDADLKISHIIRGEDHISNTPRQILIAEALQTKLPEYAHIPLIFAPDHTKLSKRHGAVAVSEYADQGYLAEALINFIVTLGWSPQVKNLPEILTIEELIRSFDLAEVQRSGAIFNLEKLDWYNREYVKRLSPKEQIERLKREWDFFTKRPENLTLELLKTNEFLPEVIKKLENLPETDFTAEKLKSVLWNFATEKGRARVLWPMRVALTGQERSPDPFIVAAVLGKEETLSRLRHAGKL